MPPSQAPKIMSSRDIKDLDPALQPLAQKFLDLTAHIEGGTFLTETYRNEADQNADWQKGRDAKGNVIDRHAIVTNARYGQSPHNCVDANGNAAARAFDFAIRLGQNELDWDAEDPAWQEAIAIGESIGLASGSHWHTIKDSPHFELPNWKSGLPFMAAA